MAVSFVKYVWAFRALLYKCRFAHVGKWTYIGKPVFLFGTKGISLGDRVRVYPGNRLETHEGGRIIIENDCSIGQNFHCTAAHELRIGSKTTILGNVFITDIDHDYTEIDVHIMEQKKIVKKTEIGENCFIGFGAAIQAGTKLGKQCIVGTHAVVRGDFPDYCVIAGVPAKIIKKYDFSSQKWIRV